VTAFEKESNLVASCLRIAEGMGVYVECIGQRKARGSGTTIGAPDLLLFVAGHVIPVECKSIRGKATLAQMARAYDREQQGVTTAFVSDDEDFIKLINTCRRGEWKQR